MAHRPGHAGSVGAWNAYTGQAAPSMGETKTAVTFGLERRAESQALFERGQADLPEAEVVIQFEDENGEPQTVTVNELLAEGPAAPVPTPSVDVRAAGPSQVEVGNAGIVLGIAAVAGLYLLTR
jgi:hypothetical protein